MRNTRIMLVDDEERLLCTTKKLFEKLGFEVLTCTSGKEALELLEQTDVHVVFLDIKMPGMDGIETLQRIKKKFPFVEVVILTGHASMEAAVEGLKLGAFDFLIKPVSMKELLENVEEASAKIHRQKQRFLSARKENQE
ncbi:response regulator [Maridesulfovibrio salexigens]|uniref:Response regulator receiver protein n=1 Tax=Maridesulfovibrio salexigens (strain ATCC 14822 / DSM 2638 / NCIMB 8403 / VKM B-1763) TaxID=526222 RepID=C6BUB0_MARSD|nr:response regulator [Maridesulfovibrio salexigens]ACS79919.1 response regulator receiver protein [Maridesulfovibrio salexigens DSM 2638]